MVQCLAEDLFVALRSLCHQAQGQTQLKDAECQNCLEKIVGLQEGMTESQKGTVGSPGQHFVAIKVIKYVL